MQHRPLGRTGVSVSKLWANPVLQPAARRRQR